MNKSILPNARFISMLSSGAGKDWYEVATELDAKLETLGLELNEEAVYLHFNNSPGAVLNGAAECRVARSIIGPLKKVNEDFMITDWQQGLVFRFSLSIKTWDELFSQCYIAWENLARKNNEIHSQFSILLKRELQKGYLNKVEVIFYPR